MWIVNPEQMEHLGGDQNSNHECVELQLGAIFSD
jgi:hypothetical protein